VARPLTSALLIPTAPSSRSHWRHHSCRSKRSDRALGLETEAAKAVRSRDGALHRLRNGGRHESSREDEGAGHLDVDLGSMGVPTSAQLRSKLLLGDGLIVAVGSPHREFVGDAVLGSRYRAFSTEEIAALPAGLEFDHGLTLSRARVWSRAVPIEAVWSRVMAADTNPDALFLGAITTVRSPDAAIIVAEGVGGGDQALVHTDAAAAEDSKVIATMNARRAQRGKPPLTAAREKRVRENRRS
jgi:hypothetical protein